MDLVFQGEVKGDVFYFLLDENLGAGGVLLLLQVLDHVGEPHCQAVVAGGGGGREDEEVKTLFHSVTVSIEIPGTASISPHTSLLVIQMFTPTVGIKDYEFWIMQIND